MPPLLRAAVVGLALVATARLARAEPAVFRVEPERTSAAFEVSYLGFARQRGQFERTSGTIVVDRERRAGSVDLVIEARSVHTGFDLRDAFLRGESMFDAERYPTLRFRSTRLGFDGDRLATVDGEITLRGVTAPLQLEVARFACAPGAIAVAEARQPAARERCDATVGGRISRRAFGMDFAYPLIGDEVELEIAVSAVSVPAETAMQ